MLYSLVRYSMAAIGVLLMGSAAATPACPDRPIALGFSELGSFYNDGTGLDQDVVDELTKRSKCRFAKSVIPRVRVWKDLEDGSLDMGVSGIETEERAKFAAFLPYIAQKNYALLSRKMPAGVMSMEDFVALPGKLRWGAVRGFRHGSYYDGLIARLKAEDRLDEVTETDQLFKMLKADRYMGMLALPMVYHLKLKEFDMADRVTVVDWKPNDPSVKHGLVLSRARFSPAEIEKWANIVDAMNRDGTMEKLIGKYLPPLEAARSLVK